MNDQQLIDGHDRLNNQIEYLRQALRSTDLLYLAQNRPFDVGDTLTGSFYAMGHLCTGDWLVTGLHLTVAHELSRHHPTVPIIHAILQYLQDGQPNLTVLDTNIAFARPHDRWEPGQWVGITPRWEQSDMHYIISNHPAGAA